MCGIAGVFRLTGRPGPEDAAAVLRMLDAQHHRGPDDWGLLVPAYPEFTAITKDLDPDRVSRYAGDGPGVTLGSRRLAIVDLSARGRMPMGDREGRAWITHNGGVYHHRDLRAALAA